MKLSSTLAVTLTDKLVDSLKDSYGSENVVVQ